MIAATSRRNLENSKEVAIDRGLKRLISFDERSSSRGTRTEDHQRRTLLAAERRDLHGWQLKSLRDTDQVTRGPSTHRRRSGPSANARFQSMAPPNRGPIEQDLRKLLDNTRREAERYASAHYRREGQEGRSGLGMRFEALEAAVIRLAQALDQLSSQHPDR